MSNTATCLRHSAGLAPASLAVYIGVTRYMEKTEQELVAGLAKIRKYRETDRKNTVYSALLLIASGLLAPIFPLAILGSIAAFVIFFYSFIKTAKAPCPRCGQPFTSNWSIPLGHNVHQCHNCKLSFDLLAKHEGKLPKSHDREWFR